MLLCEISPKIGMPFPCGKGEKINSKVNIIFVTICSESEHAEAVMGLKPYGYFTKEPANPQLLEELLTLRYPVA